jgi:Mrp family chromosome partitioning ATPase
MREVDQALARAYQRSGGERTGVPPAPHLPALGATDPEGPEGIIPRGLLPSGFAVEATPVPALEAQAEVDAEDGLVHLQWPATILSMERQFGERFERLADTLTAIRDRQHLKVVLFTSCHRAEGRTTLVLSLARALARRPGRCLLVDADLTGPMLARQLGFRPDVGLDDVIENGQSLADALYDAPDDHLSLLPLRAPVARPREFLASPVWSVVMARLRREFDLVLLDGSPLFAGLSAAVLHRSVDAAILVHNRSLTGQRALLRAREILDAGGVPLLGLAETFV